MDKYKLVPRPKEPIKSDEIRISATGSVLDYVSYARSLMEEQKMRKITIKATGNAIAGGVTLAEVLKRRFVGLHQLTKCGITTLTDVYEPTEEGLEQVIEERIVSFLEITLSLDMLDEKDPGYQPPLPEDLVKDFIQDDLGRRTGYRPRGWRGSYRAGFRGRGGFRGGFRRRNIDLYDQPRIRGDVPVERTPNGDVEVRGKFVNNQGLQNNHGQMSGSGNDGSGVADGGGGGDYHRGGGYRGGRGRGRGFRGNYSRGRGRPEMI